MQQRSGGRVFFRVMVNFPSPRTVVRFVLQHLRSLRNQPSENGNSYREVRTVDQACPFLLEGLLNLWQAAVPSRRARDTGDMSRGKGLQNLRSSIRVCKFHGNVRALQCTRAQGRTFTLRLRIDTQDHFASVIERELLDQMTHLAVPYERDLCMSHANRKPPDPDR